jgi:hypothetical protein
MGCQHAGGAFAQTGCATCDDENFALNVHVELLNLIDVTSTSIMHIWHARPAGRKTRQKALRLMVLG